MNVYTKIIWYIRIIVECFKSIHSVSKEIPQFSLTKKECDKIMVVFKLVGPLWYK